MLSFLGKWLGQEDDVATSKHPTINRDVMQATIASSDRARYLAKQIQTNMNSGIKHKNKDDLNQKYISSHDSNTTHFLESQHVTSGDWMVALVQLDTIMHGCTVTTATKQARFYNYETLAILGTIFATVSVIVFIGKYSKRRRASIAYMESTVVIVIVIFINCLLF